jgi:Kef-type K+ transport system membrane component KefB
MEVSGLVHLLWQIGAILVVSRSLGLLARRLGQPLVIAEMMAGIALGPSLLGRLSPGAMAFLFPPSSLGGLALLSQLGLVLFMFLVGLELDASTLASRSRAVVAISHTSIAVPFALGAAAGHLLWPIYAPDGVHALPFALFVGVAMSVTAFPVLARILSERGWLSSRIGALSIACAAIDDVTAWCLLAFVVCAARSRALGEALWVSGLALSFGTLMLYVVRPALSRWGLWRRAGDELSADLVAVALCLLVLSSSITELIGIHAVFGAFLLGAILPKVGATRALAEKLQVPAVVLLLPLFFAHSGLRTQIGTISGASQWLIALGLIALATLGKLGGGMIAARVAGLPWRDAGAIGILMNTRGLMELVVLNIGMDLGVISTRVFTMMVLMALVTTFATTPILKRIYPGPLVAASPEIGVARAGS